MSDGITSIGVKVEIEDAVGSGIFVEIEEVTEIPEFGFDSDDVDFTHLGSDTKEYKPGLKDGVSTSIGFNLLKNSTAGQGHLRTAGDNKETRAVRIIYPFTPTETVTFPAAIKPIKISAPVGDRITATAEIKVAGAPSWT